MVAASYLFSVILFHLGFLLNANILQSKYENESSFESYAVNVWSKNYHFKGSLASQGFLLSKSEQDFLCSVALTLKGFDEKLGWRCAEMGGEYLPLSDPCSWSGLTCASDRQHIVKIIMDDIPPFSFSQALPNLTNLPYLLDLSMPRLGLIGSISANHFPALLRTVDLSWNTLSGPLPSFSHLIQLQELSLCGNFLTDSSAMNQLPVSLRSLEVCSNQFSGSLPGLWYLGNLNSLVLSHNEFTGVIKNASHFPLNLKYLDISYNKLSGPLPFFFIMKNLTGCLIASNNHFSGPLYSSRFHSSLSCLDLENNLLSGALPSYANFTNLVELDLSGNRFSGSLPFFRNLSNLRTLDLSHNQLFGSLNIDIFPINLGILDLRDNAFSGLLTPESNFTKLCSLDLSYNQFTSLLAEVRLPRFLVHFDISYNHFHSSVPWFIGTGSQIQSIYLSGNRFSGIVYSWQFPSTLILLGLNDNNISGFDSNSSLSSIQSLDQSYNALKRFGLSFVEFSSLRSLDISHNSLDGSIETFSRLVSLESLDLSYNLYSGSINSNSFPISLIDLDLSNNNFDGSLPTTLADLKYLEILDLSSNRFSGALDSHQFPVSLLCLELGSNRFKGSINGSNFPESLEELHLQNNQIAGQLPSFANLKNLTTLTLSSNYLTGIFEVKSLPLSIGSLDVSWNRLSGTLPSFKNFTHLHFLGASNNLLHGSLLSTIFPMALAYLWLSYNSFTGSMPYLANLTNLEDIDISNNKLSGSLNERIFPASVKILVLDSNAFTGHLPPLCHAENIGGVYLRNNFLSGKLEGCDIHQALYQLEIEGNFLSGPLPSFLHYSNLQYFGCSKNLLSGSLISTQFPPSLQYLVLRNNNFVGQLPVFQNLKLLLYADLSQNQFIGRIPSFSFSSYLFHLNLSHNSFSGPFSGNTFSSFFKVIDLRSNRLTTIDSSACNLGAVEVYLANNMLSCFRNCFIPPFQDFLDILPRCIDETDAFLCNLVEEWKINEAIGSSAVSGDPIHINMNLSSSGSSDSMETYQIHSNATYYLVSFDPVSFVYGSIEICLDIYCDRVLEKYSGSAFRNSWAGIRETEALIVSHPEFYVMHNPSKIFSDDDDSYDRTPIGVNIDIVPFYPRKSEWNCRLISTNTLENIIEAVDYCTWPGITCERGNKGAITELNLDAFGIVAEINLVKILNAFPRLVRLKLSNNAFYGKLDFIPHLHLKLLELSFNSLTGSVPCTIVKLRRLETLSLKQNQLSGSVPACLADIGLQSKKVFMDMRYNKFSGQIDSYLCTISPQHVHISLKNNPLLNCYASPEGCTVELDSNVEYCAPTYMPTSPPTTTPESFPIDLIGGIGGAVFVLFLSASYFIQTRYAKIASEDQTKYLGLPLHKLVSEMHEVTMNDIDANKDTVTRSTEDGKSLLRLILDVRPKYAMSTEVFLCIVNALLFQGTPTEFQVHWITLLQSEDDLVMDTIQIILEDRSRDIDNFVYGKLETGRTYVEVASFCVSKLLLRYTYLHKQFDLNESYEYRSKYCEVIIAEYHPLIGEELDRFAEKNSISWQSSSCNNSFRAPVLKGKQSRSDIQIVALKFIKNRISFLNEIAMMNQIQKAGKPNKSKTELTSGEFQDYFLLLLHAYDGDEGNADDDAKLFRRDAIHRNYLDYPYCIVFEAAKINLQSFFVYSDVLGNDWEEIERIITQVVSAVAFLHHHNIVHGDIKPTNIMLTYDGRYKLIDLDAATEIGKPLGKKVSTAYSPPEMIIDNPVPGPKMIINDGGSPPGYEYLIAQCSYDIWSCGILLYYLIAGNLPFTTNNYDCISSVEDLLELSRWSNEIKNHKIQGLMYGLQSGHSLTQKRITKDTRLHIHNLLALLLQKTPSKRPSTVQVLQHPFFTKISQPRMVGHEATYDVFISYRVASDSKHAARLYRELSNVHGLRVWMDKYCLEAGKNWEQGFCEGLIKSSAFVCLISRDGMFHSENPNQNFVTLNESTCDNCLLEWRLALEMQERGMLMGIFPLFVGRELHPQSESIVTSLLADQDVDIEKGIAISSPTSVLHSFGNFFEECKNSLYNPGNLPVRQIDSVEKKVNDLVDHFGYVTSYLSTQGSNQCTVKSIWTRIVSNHGGFIEGDYEESIHRVAKSIAEMTQHSLQPQE